MKTDRIIQLLAIAAVSLLLAQCRTHDPRASTPRGSDSGLDAMLPA